MIVQLIEKEFYFLLKKKKQIIPINLNDDKKNLNYLKLYIIKKTL